MNEDLEFIQSVIKKEIKTWTGYKRELVDDYGEEEFIRELVLEVEEYSDNGELELTEVMILNILDDLMTERLFPF